MKTIIGLFTLNNAQTIGSRILLLKEQVDTILVLDKGSSDETVSIAQAAGAEVLPNDISGETRVFRMMQAAASRSADALVIKQNPDAPLSIPYLQSGLNQISGGKDIVFRATGSSQEQTVEKHPVEVDDLAVSFFSARALKYFVETHHPIPGVPIESILTPCKV